MENGIVRLGVVGLKRGGDVAQTVIGDKNVVVRAIADRDPEALAACKASFEAKGAKDLLCFDSYEALLASDIDAVYNCDRQALPYPSYSDGA